MTKTANAASPLVGGLAFPGAYPLAVGVGLAKPALPVLGSTFRSLERDLFSSSTLQSGKADKASSSPLWSTHRLCLALGICVMAVLLPATSGAAVVRTAKAPKAVRNRNAPVDLYAVNSKESLQLRLRDDKGRPLRGVQKRFDYFMRCHHTNKQHPMNPRLVRVLVQVGKHYPGRRVEVVSGYRHPSVAKNPHSPHMQGLACDFRIVGVKNTELRDYLRKDFQKVGVGYYPNSAFVHLDVRKDRSAFWIDYSGPGERAVYSENAAADLKSGRADTYKPTKIDGNWVSDTEETGDDAKPDGVQMPGEKPDSPTNRVAGAVESEGTASASAAGPGGAERAAH